MGRPPKGRRTLSKSDVLRHALHLLDKGGAPALTFKALATDLGVTPMAVAHHVGTRAEMIRDLVGMGFDGVEAPVSGADPQARIRALMLRYCARAIRHPAIIRCVLEEPALLTGPLEVLTAQLRHQIAASGPPEDEIEVLLGLIVDYTHGFAFAAASAPGALSLDDYAPGLDWMLNRIGPG